MGVQSSGARRLGATFSNTHNNRAHPSQQAYMTVQYGTVQCSTAQVLGTRSQSYLWPASQGLMRAPVGPTFQHTPASQVRSGQVTDNSQAHLYPTSSSPAAAKHLGASVHMHIHCLRYELAKLVAHQIGPPMPHLKHTQVLSRAIFSQTATPSAPAWARCQTPSHMISSANVLHSTQACLLPCPQRAPHYRSPRADVPPACLGAWPADTPHSLPPGLPK